jgi:mono/diheme cytochrome c family protein
MMKSRAMNAPPNALESVGVLLLVASWFTSLSAFAGTGVSHTPELSRGEHVARLVCSACHVVARDQEYPPILAEATPSFVDIANRPGVSAQSLQHFVTSTHWDDQKSPMAMPNPMLSKKDVQAVAQYILSLRNR